MTPAPVHRRRSTCRGCGGGTLRFVLALGPTPLANSFPRSCDDFPAEPAFPLDLYFCETCSLLQLVDVIDPEVLFRHYIYVTGTSTTIAAHNEAYARALVARLGLTAADLVVEVGSNDGSLLRRFRPYGVRTLGVEPASNIAAMARDAGVETVDGFFGGAAGRRIRAEHGPARAVIANNVLAHVDDPQDFLEGACQLVADDGLVLAEVPYLGELLDRLEYDTVYHEHLCYFSVTALARVCERAGLVLVDLDRVPVHGGSIRVYAGRPERYGSHAPAVSAMCEEERGRGLASLARYERFAADVAASRAKLVGLLRDLVARGKTLAGYGAPAKGNTLLNYCGIGPALLPYTVDRSPLKVGRYTPGMHIPVLPVEVLRERQPDYTLILAWNFAEEILGQEAEYRARGGRFIIPVPEPLVV